MRTFLVTFLLAFGVSAALTPLLRMLASRLGGVDRAFSSRKVHTQPIPRLGGIAMVLGFFVPLVGLFFWQNDVTSLFFAHPERVLGLFAGGAAIALLGLYDDVRGADARVKFTVQTLVAVGMYLLGYSITLVVNPFGDPIHLGMLSGPLTVLWIVGIVNAMNLIDGLDGLAAGVAAIVVALTFAVALSRVDVLMCLFMAALFGAALGFLLYNWNPASIFMGDTGSMFLGFVLGVTTVATNQKSSTAVALLVPVVALGLPITDTLLAMLRRALAGRPLFAADREHIHHRLLDLGLTHRQTVLLLYAVCVMLAVVAFGLTYANSRGVAFMLVVLGGLVFAGLRRLGYLQMSADAFQSSLAARERNGRLRALLREIGAALDRAPHFDGVWQALRPVPEALGADTLTLDVSVPPRLNESRELRATPLTIGGPFERDPLVVRLPIEVGTRAGTAFLEVVWRGRGSRIDRDHEIFLERLIRRLETALVRIHRQRAAPVAAAEVPESEEKRRVASVMFDA